MFNSFLDGSKPSIESTAVANATGLTVPSNGLLYPPASVEDIPFVTRPREEGGVLERKGMVEVISSLEADGRAIPYEIRMGVWVTVEGETEYIRNCFEEYKAHTDPSGRLLHALQALAPDRPGSGLFGRGHRPARRSHRRGALLERRRGGHRLSATSSPANCWTAKAATPSGASCCPPTLPSASAACRSAWRMASSCSARSPRVSPLRWDDVAMDTSTRAYALRREMEAMFS